MFFSGSSSSSRILRSDSSWFNVAIGLNSNACWYLHKAFLLIISICLGRLNLNSNGSLFINILIVATYMTTVSSLRCFLPRISCKSNRPSFLFPKDFLRAWTRWSHESNSCLLLLYHNLASPSNSSPQHNKMSSYDTIRLHLLRSSSSRKSSKLILDPENFKFHL
uniref:Uncharacterized protein n=1 Tax=Cacopsylla melanoneura TaxID=428564 RepID=A0A8D8TRE6_9HEMI